MSDELGDLPKAQTDEIDTAPGGVDATPLESDVGQGDDSLPPVTPDEPLSAQTDVADVPDAIQEPEESEPDEQATDNTDESAPSG